MHRLFYKLLGIISITLITLILFYKANYYYFLGVCILLSILFKFIDNNIKIKINKIIEKNKLKEKINKIIEKWENKQYGKWARKFEYIDDNWLNGDGDD